MVQVGNKRVADEPVAMPPAGRTRVDDELLGAAFANVPHGLCMFDADKRLVISNPRYAEMYGLPPELVTPGTSLEAIVAYRRKAGNAPVDFPSYASHEGIDFRQQGNSIFEFRLEDGRSIRLNHLVLKDGGYVATHEDVTAQVRSEDRFRSIFDAVSEGIFILDVAKGKFSEVNGPGCLMLGYTAEELAGSDLHVLSSGVEPYTQAGMTEWIKRATATGRPQRFEWQSRARDGRIFPIQVSMRFASIGDRGVVVAIVRDLTEREVIESQLRQSQKMEAIGQLTGGMAHDFNNLLGVIIGNLELLREAFSGNPQVDQLAAEALDAALGGADLTRRLLAFARRQPLQTQHIDLADLVARAAKLFRRVLGENIEISLDLAAGTYPVVADPTQLEAALTNLATNARDAMPRGGRLIIATGNRTLDADYAAENRDVLPGEYAVIEVTDTGTGMTPEVISHAFDPFYTTKERDKGTGLGLSMVFGFLKQSGGHVSVYSEVGVGTTFRLYLPRADRASVAEPASDGPSLSLSKGETVLVVEDNAALRRAAVRQLRELGYNVLDVENGAAALTELETKKIDLLFSDVVMPGNIDGFELATMVRSRWPDVKVILTSGYPEGKMLDTLAPGGFPLLNKPYRKQALARILRETLDR